MWSLNSGYDGDCGEREPGLSPCPRFTSSEAWGKSFRTSKFSLVTRLSFSLARGIDLSTKEQKPGVGRN